MTNKKLLLKEQHYQPRKKRFGKIFTQRQKGVTKNTHGDKIAKIVQ